MVMAMASTRTECMVNGCRRKPFFTQPDPGACTGDEPNANPTVLSRLPTHCRGHRPEGCPSPRRESSAKKKSKATKKQAHPDFGSACHFEGCKKRASHGVDRSQYPTHCLAHRDPVTMVVDFRHKLCEKRIYPPCTCQASYGWPRVVSAADAAAAGAPTVSAREPQTGSEGSYTNEGDNAGRGQVSLATRKLSLRFCVHHKEPGMVDLRNPRRCPTEGCGKRVTHGFEGEKATVCAMHRVVGMMDVVTKRCAVDGCVVAPRFGDLGQQPRFCGRHRLEGMVNVKDRRCEQTPCQSQPSFALVGEKKARFCAIHRTDGMINVRNQNRCMYQGDGEDGGQVRLRGCDVHPTFANIGAKTPLFCVEHAEPGMVNLQKTKEAKRRFFRGPGSPFDTGFANRRRVPLSGRKRPLPPPLTPPRNFSGIYSPQDGAPRTLHLAGAWAAGMKKSGSPITWLPPPGRTWSSDATAPNLAGEPARESKRLTENHHSSKASDSTPIPMGLSESDRRRDGNNPTLLAVHSSKLMAGGQGRRFSIDLQEAQVRSLSSSTSRPVGNGGDRVHVPFWQSSLALWPLAVPRGSPAIEGVVEAAVAAAAIVGNLNTNEVARETTTPFDSDDRQVEERGDALALREQGQEESPPTGAADSVPALGMLNTNAEGDECGTSSTFLSIPGIAQPPAYSNPITTDELMLELAGELSRFDEAEEDGGADENVEHD